MKDKNDTVTLELELEDNKATSSKPFEELNSEELFRACIYLYENPEEFPEEALEFSKSVLSNTAKLLLEWQEVGFDIEELEPKLAHDGEGGLTLSMSYKGVDLQDGMTPENYLVLTAKGEV